MLRLLFNMICHVTSFYTKEGSGWNACARMKVPTSEACAAEGPSTCCSWDGPSPRWSTGAFEEPRHTGWSQVLRHPQGLAESPLRRVTFLLRSLCSSLSPLILPRWEGSLGTRCRLVGKRGKEMCKFWDSSPQQPNNYECICSKGKGSEFKETLDLHFLERLFIF